MKQSVLFVDDEAMLRDMYASFSEHLLNKYSVHVAPGGNDALKLMQQHKFDVIVTDLTMPSMDGLQFLARAVKAQPDAARIIISGYADRLKIAQCLFVGHRYFDKPCDMVALRDLLLRLASFSEIVSNDKVRRLIGGLGSLPGPPDTFLKLEKLMQSPTLPMKEVGRLIEQDPSVAAKLLQIVNSAQLGLPQKVLNVIDAVQLLGLNLVRALVLGLQAFAAYKNQPGKGQPPADLWDHSLRVATAARQIARAQKFSLASCERAFLAGLLHDVGRIVIHANAADELEEVARSAERFRIPLVEAELRRFGASYAQIGAYLLSLWGIDEEVTGVIQFQEQLSNYTGKDTLALAALHVAHCADAGSSIQYPLDTEALEAFGFHGAERWSEEAFADLPHAA
jgi:HD-like signal output (HDOD) protein/ActR/RegA family two-component response regulator